MTIELGGKNERDSVGEILFNIVFMLICLLKFYEGQALSGEM